MVFHKEHFIGIAPKRVLDPVPALALKRRAPFEHVQEHDPDGFIVRLFQSKPLFDESGDDPVGSCGVGRIQENDEIRLLEAGADPFKMGAFNDPAFRLHDVQQQRIPVRLAPSDIVRVGSLPDHIVELVIGDAMPGGERPGKRRFAAADRADDMYSIRNHTVHGDHRIQEN